MSENTEVQGEEGVSMAQDRVSVEDKEVYVPKSTKHYLPASEVEMIPKPEDFEPDPNFPKGHRFYGSRRCTAWNSRKGQQCMALAMDGSTKCYVHGGKQAHGLAHHATKHGRYSKYLPQDLLAKYQEIKDDPELLSLRNEIDLVSVRVAQLLQSLDGYPTSQAWFSDLQSAMLNFRQGVATQNQQRTDQAYEKMKDLIEQGADHQQVWGEITSLLEARKRLANSERERIADANAMWTAEQAMLFVTTLSAGFKDVLNTHIDNKELKKEILSDLSLMIRKLINKNAKV